MLKVLLVSLFLVTVLVSCSDTNPVDAFNFERDVPGWLKDKINVMNADARYTGTTVYRYNWDDRNVYQINVPGTRLCSEVYEQNHRRLYFETDNEIAAFHAARKNELLIWKCVGK